MVIVCSMGIAIGFWNKYIYKPYSLLLEKNSQYSWLVPELNIKFLKIQSIPSKIDFNGVSAMAITIKHVFSGYVFTHEWKCIRALEN